MYRYMITGVHDKTLKLSFVRLNAGNPRGFYYTGIYTKAIFPYHQETHPAVSAQSWMQMYHQGTHPVITDQSWVQTLIHQGPQILNQIYYLLHSRLENALTRSGANRVIRP